MKRSQTESEQQLRRRLDRIASDYAKRDAVEPPALLDQAVLNRARRAVEKTPPFWRRQGWQRALAVTAVVTLVMTVVIQQQPQAPEPGMAPAKREAAQQAVLQDRMVQEAKKPEFRDAGRESGTDDFRSRQQQEIVTQGSVANSADAGDLNLPTGEPAPPTLYSNAPAAAPVVGPAEPSATVSSESPSDTASAQAAATVAGGMSGEGQRAQAGKARAAGTDAASEKNLTEMEKAETDAEESLERRNEADAFPDAKKKKLDQVEEKRVVADEPRLDQFGIDQSVVAQDGVDQDGGDQEGFYQSAPGQLQQSWPEAEPWLEHIAGLRADGNLEGFERELQMFLEIYPDYPVPPEWTE